MIRTHPFCFLLTSSVSVLLDSDSQGDWVNLAELQVFDATGSNVALNKPVLSTSILDSGLYPNNFLVDGIFTNFAHTHSGRNEYFQLDLLQSTTITSIALYNRADCCQERILYQCVTLFDEAMNVVQQFPCITTVQSNYTFNTTAHVVNYSPNSLVGLRNVTLSNRLSLLPSVCDGGCSTGSNYVCSTNDADSNFSTSYINEWVQASNPTVASNSVVQNMMAVDLQQTGSLLGHFSIPFFSWCTFHIAMTKKKMVLQIVLVMHIFSSLVTSTRMLT